MRLTRVMACRRTLLFRAFSGILFLNIFCIALGLTRGPSAEAAPATVVLIPGTLNSLLPGSARWIPSTRTLEANPYYSRDALDSFRAKGLRVHVTPGLAGLGSFESNGEVVLRDLREWYLKAVPDRSEPITLIAHSAGGFYALHALMYDQDSLPIARIIFVSTPLEGSEAADRFFGPSGQWPKFPFPWLNLTSYDGLPQLSTLGVTRFLAKTEVPSQVELLSVAGSQPSPKKVSEFRSARFLAPFFALTASWIPGESDGIVSLHSAWGTNAKLPVKPLYNLKMPLDHSKQVLDWRLFQLMGNTEAEIIHAQQIRTYSALADIALGASTQPFESSEPADY